MSWEAWGESDDGMDGYVTEKRAEEFFIAGAQQMREMLARFVEQDGNPTLAMSLRANWIPNWGPDPGKPENIEEDLWGAV